MRQLALSKVEFLTYNLYMHILVKYLLLITFFFYFSLKSHAAESYVLKLDTEATQARLDLIKNAQKEIYISYYIFQNDRIGLEIMAQVYQAKIINPNLDIRIIIDGSANNINKEILYFIEKSGIEILEFHPIPKLFPGLKNINVINFFYAIGGLNKRMHDKMLLIDGEKLIVGGRNMQQEYFGFSNDASHSKNFYDLDLYVNSPKTGSEAKEYFLKLWESNHLGKIRYRKKHMDELAQIKAKEIIGNQSFDYNEILTTWKDYVVPANDEKVQLHHSFDFSKNNFNSKYLADKFFHRLAEIAKENIIFETPYFLPTKHFYRMLKKLKRKNVNVTVITNSYCSNDMDVAAGAYEIRKKKILRSGIKLFEYEDSSHLHAKAVAIDHQYSLVGTFNFDPRSTYINSELVLEVENESITNSLLDKLNHDMTLSKEIVLDENGRSPKRDRDCEKTRMQKFIYQIGKYGSLFPFLYMQL